MQPPTPTSAPAPSAVRTHGNRAQRRAAMHAQGPVLSQFGLRNDAIRRDAQQRAAETIKARAEAAALTTAD